MAEVKAFAGLRFGSLPLADVIAPPYDVISPDEQDQLYARSPYNVVRLELGREPDRYAEARRCFQEWRQAGVLRQDEPSLYVYEQRFYGGKVRRGLFGRVKLEPWSAGVILPHEETLTKPKTDRLELLRAVKANVSPVFALYEDPEKELAAMLASVSRRPPTSEAKDGAGMTDSGQGFLFLDIKDALPALSGFAQLANQTLPPAVENNLRPLRSLLLFGSRDGDLQSFVVYVKTS